jgi:hypothetical protein
MSIDASVYILFCLNSILAIDIIGYFCIITIMLYVLHHPKGALMISAGDKEQVRDWSRRQLGTRAGLISISEKDCKETVEAVERSGTGIEAMEAEGCLPLISIMANFVQSMSDDDHMECDSHLGDPRLAGREPVWH